MLSLSYDLHIHSCLSPCGDDESTPANIVGMAYVKGLDVIALTDHNTARNCVAAKEVADENDRTISMCRLTGAKCFVIEKDYEREMDAVVDWLDKQLGK